MIKTVKITSFGYEHTGTKDENDTLLTAPLADITLDVRRMFPASDDADLDGLTGLDEMVYERVLTNAVARSLAVQTAIGAHMLMNDSDLAHLTIAIGSSGGHRRAVVIARQIVTTLAELNVDNVYALAIEHRDLGRPDPQISGQPPAHDDFTL
ncbi:RapZ C-terminal domain-containing protein [Streptomyces goshikiensis]|uniref:RapZ C-terminal domain-containing protein n=1 Tax=Streptomyces goshikiensis TaxID=1942 RepID=UPI00365C599F